MESLLRLDLWSLNQLPQVFNKVSLSDLPKLDVSQCCVSSGRSYPLPRLVEFHPVHMRISDQPETKGTPCRFLQLIHFSPALSALQIPASSSSVFSAQCNPYALLVFPLLAPKSEKYFQAEIRGSCRTHMGSFPSSDIRGWCCQLYHQISENSISYILTSILADYRAR